MSGKKTEKAKPTSKEKALAVVDSIVSGDPPEDALKAKGLTQAQFDRLAFEAEFLKIVRRRIAAAVIKTELLVAQYGQTAVAKLITLMECDKEETSRKACLDLIELSRKQTQDTVIKDTVKEITESPCLEFSPTQASALLAVLAGDNHDEAP